MTLRPFHLAFPVHDLSAARAFWGGLIGCPEGRSSDEWIDFDFYGHQIVAHLAPGRSEETSNPVDGHDVPVPHFGIVLAMEDWQALADRLTAAGTKFAIEPHVRPVAARAGCYGHAAVREQRDDGAFHPSLGQSESERIRLHGWVQKKNAGWGAGVVVA